MAKKAMGSRKMAAPKKQTVRPIGSPAGPSPVGPGAMGSGMGQVAMKRGGMVGKSKMKKYSMGGQEDSSGPVDDLTKKLKSAGESAARNVRETVKKISPSAAKTIQSGYNKTASAVKSIGKSLGFKKGGTVGKSKKR